MTYNPTRFRLSKYTLIISLLTIGFLSGCLKSKPDPKETPSSPTIQSTQSPSTGPSQTLSETKQVCINTHCFTAEIARTDAQRQIGLMNRNHLDNDRAMLFVFNDNKMHHFWMKNTLIPLDIIWITEQNTILFIKQNAQPLDETPISPPGKAKYVLEINGGLSQKLNFKTGDKVKLL